MTRRHIFSKMRESGYWASDSCDVEGLPVRLDQATKSDQLIVGDVSEFGRLGREC